MNQISLVLHIILSCSVQGKFDIEKTSFEKKFKK